jgi:hypothetical protein
MHDSFQLSPGIHTTNDALTLCGTAGYVWHRSCFFQGEFESSNAIVRGNAVSETAEIRSAKYVHAKRN